VQKNNGELTIPCEACSGTGRTPITPKYLVTLNALKTLKRATCTKLLHTMMVSEPNLNIVALHKRVKRMEAHGLVKRIKRVTPKGADPRQRAWVFAAA